MKILIIGSNGFLGRHVTGHFQAKGYDVIPAQRSPALQGQPIIDLSEPATFNAIPTDVDIVINCAALVPADQQRHALDELDRVNGKGLFHLLEHARHQAYRLIHISSAHAGTQAAQMNCPLPPLGTYEASKLAGEVLCEFYRQTYNLNVSVVKGSYMYGAHMRENTVFWNFINRAQAGKPLRITGHPAQSFNFVYIKDVIRVIEHALNNATPILAATSDEDTSLLTLAQTIRDSISPATPIETVEPVPEKIPPQFRCDPPSLTPEYSLSQGIADLVEEMESCVSP